MPDTYGIVLLAQSVPAILYLVTLSLLSIIIATWWRSVGIAMLAGLFVSGALIMSQRFESEVANPTNQPIRIATWNTHYWDRDEGKEAFRNYIQSLDADILLLQEWMVDDDGTPPPPEATRLEACCGYPYIWHQGRMVIASRLPGELEQTDHPRVLAVTIEDVRLVNTHIPVHFSARTGFLGPAFWSYVNRTAGERQLVHAAAEAQIDRNQHALLAGDFNATALMPSTRRLLSKPSGLGWLAAMQPTFPYDRLALWRLDHMVASPGLLRNCTVGPSNPVASDHKPILCDLHPPRAGSDQIGSFDGAKSAQPVRRGAQRDAAHRAKWEFSCAATQPMG
ncbi:MAG: endonuclease/exonuclease/phosphatase family protein [Pseudomonadota bacterium]